MTPVRIRVERLAAILGAIAIVFFSLASGWGMFRPIIAGHYASVASMGIVAENMRAWRIIAPFWDYTATKPDPLTYYCHHPFGIYWTQVPLVSLIGHHTWVLFVPAVIMSTATVWLIHQTARNAWGRIPAAAAACAFATLPIDLTYSNFGSLEVFVIFGCALFFWGHSRMMTTSKRRYLLASVAGVLVACTGDWPGFIVIGVVLAWGLARAFVLPRRVLPLFKFEPYARWWALSTTAAVVLLLFWIVLFHHYGKLTEVLSSADSRSSGSTLPLDAVLEARKFRIDSMFTPPAILVGKLAVPLALLRFVLRRRDEELYSLATLLAATVQYVVFKQGADVHIFWPHYFGLYFALVFGQVVATTIWLIEAILRRIKPRFAPATAGITALVIVVAWTLLILPDGLSQLYTGRATAGRFNEERIRSDSDAVHALEMLAPRMPAGAILDGHSSEEWGWHLSWSLHGLHQIVSTLPSRGDAAAHPYFFGRLSMMKAGDVQKLSKDFALQIFGDVVVVDKRNAAGPVLAYAFDEREPNALEWYFLGGVEPVHQLAFDAFATWEWRIALGQPAEGPHEPPRTIDQRRILHNIAVANHDDVRAKQLLVEIEATLDHTAASQFSDGMRLVGVRRIGGTCPRAEIWFLASDTAETGEWVFAVRGRMDGPASWSRIPPDTLDRDVGMPLVMSPKLWTKGHLYRHVVPLYHRVGVETFYGLWWSKDSSHAPTVVGRGDNHIDLLTER